MRGGLGTTPKEHKYSHFAEPGTGRLKLESVDGNAVPLCRRSGASMLVRAGGRARKAARPRPSPEGCRLLVAFLLSINGRVSTRLPRWKTTAALVPRSLRLAGSEVPPRHEASTKAAEATLSSSGGVSFTSSNRRRHWRRAVHQGSAPAMTAGQRNIARIHGIHGEEQHANFLVPSVPDYPAVTKTSGIRHRRRLSTVKRCMTYMNNHSLLADSLW